MIVAPDWHDSSGIGSTGTSGETFNHLDWTEAAPVPDRWPANTTCSRTARLPFLPVFNLHVCTVMCCPGAVEDDALLEGVVLLGALAGWDERDRQLAESGLVGGGCWQ